MSEIAGEAWYTPFLAPSIIVVVALAVIGWLRSYLAGKKTNIKEARLLEEDRIDRADKKGVKERSDAKILETEKTEAATTLKDSAAAEAIEVKKESREYMNNKMKFSDQEHAHQHSELTNKLQTLNTKIEQVSKDLKTHLRTEHNVDENSK
jgi:biopolymer transport protein ExbB/TolQ